MRSVLKPRISRTAVAVLTVCFSLRGSLAAGLPRAQPEDAGMSGLRLAEIDDVVADALAARQMPGCVVLLARQGKIVFVKAYGRRSIEPTETPMTCDTVF